jgi:hypothetical protein
MCCEGSKTLLFLDCFLVAFLGPFLPLVRTHLRPAQPAAKGSEPPVGANPPQEVTASQATTTASVAESPPAMKE